MHLRSYTSYYRPDADNIHTHLVICGEHVRLGHVIASLLLDDDDDRDVFAELGNSYHMVGPGHGPDLEHW